MIRIIDCQGGNAGGLARIIRERFGYKVKLARGPLDLSKASYVILPASGSVNAMMNSIKPMGIIPKLEKVVFKKKIPFLATGLAMQILFDYGKSINGKSITRCLGWLPGIVEKYDTDLPFAPKKGLYGCIFVKETPFTAIDQCGEYYFQMNGFHVVPANKSDIWAWADNDVNYIAAVQRENIYGINFRLDKGGENSIKLLENLLNVNKKAEE